MQIQITIKSLAQQASEIKAERINLPNIEEKTTLQILLSALVEQQITVLHSKVSGEDRTYIPEPLSNNYLQLLTQTGKADFDLRYNDTEADIQAAQKNMLQCFKDGLFAVFIDDDEVSDLEQEISLTPETIISFIRLTFLSGGYF